jgi:hypothetical protein
MSLCNLYGRAAASSLPCAAAAAAALIQDRKNAEQHARSCLFCPRNTKRKRGRKKERKEGRMLCNFHYPCSPIEGINIGCGGAGGVERCKGSSRVSCVRKGNFTLSFNCILQCKSCTFNFPSREIEIGRKDDL